MDEWMDAWMGKWVDGWKAVMTPGYTRNQIVGKLFRVSAKQGASLTF